MPITFHYPLPDRPGKPDVLRSKGLRIKVLVRAHAEHAKLSGGRPAPPETEGMGQIDTGADYTMVDGPRLGSALRMFPVTDRAVMRGAAVLATDLRANPARKRPAIALELVLPDLKWAGQIRKVVVSDGIGDGLLVVIGRDVLSLATLTYDGVAGRFSFSIQ